MPTLRALLYLGYQAFNRFFQARDALPAQQLHAGRALELRQFLLEREQAQAAAITQVEVLVRAVLLVW
jgi:hypothetical protein